MVQLLPILGAVSFLSSAVLAAPTRWPQYEEENNLNVHEPEYQQELEHERTTLRQVENQYEHTTVEELEHETRVQQHETTTLREQEAHETATYEYIAPVHEQLQEQEQYQPDHEQYRPEHEQLQEQEEYEYTSLREQEEHETTTEHETSTQEHETTTLREQELEHPTSTAEHVLPTYGSGAADYGAGYEDCVSQCAARFPPPQAQIHPPPVNNAVEGNGNVHVVMVAPEGGGLKYFPFALNATVGDTVRYVWTTPANHTATLSSSLAICNRSAEAEGRSFVSGVRNAATEMQIFDVVVETEEPQFFYCSVQQHCERGMWGIINPSTEFGGANSVGAKFDEWVQGNPDLLAAWEYAQETVRGTSAENWGSNINLDNIPESAYPQVAANVMFTRANFAANPGMLELNSGATTPDGSPVAIVSDLNTLLSASNPDPNAANSPAADTAPENAADNTSGALSRSTSSGVIVAAFVGLVGYMLF